MRCNAANMVWIINYGLWIRTWHHDDSVCFSSFVLILPHFRSFFNCSKLIVYGHNSIYTLAHTTNTQLLEKWECQAGSKPKLLIETLLEWWKLNFCFISNRNFSLNLSPFNWRTHQESIYTWMKTSHFDHKWLSIEICVQIIKFPISISRLN